MSVGRALVAAAILLATPGSFSGDARSAVPREPLRLVSYFRVDAGWTKLWSDWRPDVVERDLGRLASLRANTVRAIVPPGLFGYPHPSPTYAARLRQFVTLAARHGLRVQLTLFDWWYEWADLRGSRTWARELLRPYVDDRRIATIELKNELVLKPHTVAWARALLPFVRSLAGGRIPVTLSVTGTDPVAQLAALKRGLGAALPDAFDIHYYGGGGELAYDAFVRAKAVAAPTPVRVGETGYPTTTARTGFGGVPRTRSAQEAAQAHFLASVAWAARAAGLPPVGVWVLDDLAADAVPDRRVEEDDPELHYGLFRTDGSAKPAAAVVRAAFSGEPPLAFNGGFEEAVESETGASAPARWSIQGTDAVAVDRAVARQGAASARIGASAGASLSVTPPDGGLRGGERIAVGVWARRAGPAGRVFAVVEWLDRARRRVGLAASRFLPADASGWRRVGVTARAPRGAAYLRIALVVGETAAPVWFDDVSFTRSQR